MGTAALIFLGLLAWIAILDISEDIWKRPMDKMKYLYIALAISAMVVVIKGLEIL